MLYLTPNVSSVVCVTLWEKAVNQTNPYFTWQITSADSRNQYVFAADDFSTAPNYYNLFTFSAIYGATMGLTAGVIPAYSGQYSYEVYEMTNQYDLDLNNAVGMVETGILNIIATYSTIATFTASQNTIAVFKNIKF